MATQKQMIEKIVKELKEIKKNQPNGELKHIEIMVSDMQDQLIDLNKRIMDPEVGLIVQTNKNTAFREECEITKPKIEENFKALMRWKTMVDWGAGVTFVALVGAVVKFFFGK